MGTVPSPPSPESILCCGTVLCGDGGVRFVDVVAGTLCYEICTPENGVRFLKMSLAANGTSVAVISDAEQV